MTQNLKRGVYASVYGPTTKIMNQHPADESATVSHSLAHRALRV